MEGEEDREQKEQEEYDERKKREYGESRTIEQIIGDDAEDRAMNETTEFFDISTPEIRAHKPTYRDTLDEEDTDFQLEEADLYDE